MSNINDASWVRDQYASASNLQTRISIHEKYSTNPQSFADWLLCQYPLRPGDRILDVGCGTGSMWRERCLPDGCSLTLADISPAMVDRARAHLSGAPGVFFACADIQALPYPDGCFDVVVANMMLYHVPDIARALAEVRRVLRPGGCFCCSTFGENGIARFVDEVMAGIGSRMTQANTFTLQNGEAWLRTCFAKVARRDYADELRVTDARDMLDYIRSMQGISMTRAASDTELLSRLVARSSGGVIRVPKEYGCFIART